MSDYEYDIAARDLQVTRYDMEGAKDKVKHLPGTKLSPEVVLHRTLQKVENIESVIVVIKNKDGTLENDWSSQPLSAMALSLKVLEKDFDRAMDATVPGTCPDCDEEDAD